MRKTDNLAFSPYMKILKKSCRVSRNTSWFFIRRVRMESWCLFWARIATWVRWNIKTPSRELLFTSCRAVSELLSRIRFSKNLRISFLFSEAEMEESIGVWPNLSLDLRAVTSASQLNLRFKILTKPSVRISTKILLHKHYKTSAAKCWANSSFKVLPELRLQPLGLKSEQKCSFRTKRQSPNLQQTVANTILIINISNSNSLNKY